MELNWLRHPIRTVRQAHQSLIEQTIDANLRCARDHAARGNYEGFHRHCGHAENLARHHKPGRLAEVEQMATNGVESVTNPSESTHSETATATANA